MVRTFFLVILVSMLSFACDQDKNTANFPRTEINPVAPNLDIAKLMNFPFEETTPYRTVDQWAYMDIDYLWHDQKIAGKN